MNVYCGLDWAENHHDVALVNDAGELLAKQRITDDADGYRSSWISSDFPQWGGTLGLLLSPQYRWVS